MNATEADAHIRSGFAELLDMLRAGPDKDENARDRAEQAARSITRNDEAIEREWLALGVEPMRASNGRPISLTLAKTMGMVQIVSEAAE